MWFSGHWQGFGQPCQAKDTEKYIIYAVFEPLARPRAASKSQITEKHVIYYGFGALLHYVLSTLISFFDHFGIILGVLWHHVWSTLASFLDQFGIIFEAVWHHFLSTLALFLEHFGIVLGPRWHHF